MRYYEHIEYSIVVKNTVIFLVFSNYNSCFIGSINLCPLMRYKLDLTGEPIEREISLFEIEIAKKNSTPSLMQNIQIGLVHDNITINDIYGF